MCGVKESERSPTLMCSPKYCHRLSVIEVCLPRSSPHIVLGSALSSRHQHHRCSLVRRRASHVLFSPFRNMCSPKYTLCHPGLLRAHGHRLSGCACRASISGTAAACLVFCFSPLWASCDLGVRRRAATITARRRWRIWRGGSEDDQAWRCGPVTARGCLRTKFFSFAFRGDSKCSTGLLGFPCPACLVRLPRDVAARSAPLHGFDIKAFSYACATALARRRALASLTRRTNVERKKQREASEAWQSVRRRRCQVET